MDQLHNKKFKRNFAKPIYMLRTVKGETNKMGLIVKLQPKRRV